MKKYILSIPMQTSFSQGSANPEDLPDRRFCEIFNLYDRRMALKLWKVYKNWQKRTEADNYKRFADSLDSVRNNAQAAYNAWTYQLPNAKKGEKYKTCFDLPDCVADFKPADLSRLGLRMYKNPVAPGQCVIEGEPHTAGEYAIVFEYIWPGYIPPLPFLKGELKLVINPDPRELWKDIPTDPAIEYFKKDEESQILILNDALMLAGSTRGRSHAHKGAARDDDFELGWDADTRWHILAVADGAGSAHYSRKGAELACNAAMKSCAHGLNEATGLDCLLQSIEQPVLDEQRLIDAKKMVYHILPQAALEGLKAIRQEAQKMGREPKEYATTLLLAAVKEFPAGWVILSFQIGDGCMGILRGPESDLRSELLAEPDEGEFGGQTRFITMQDMFESQNLMRRVRIDIAADFKALILMSDGISDAKFSTLANMRNSEYWRKLWEELLPVINSPAPAEEILSWLKFWSAGNHDDRTIALLVERQINE